MAVDIFRCTPKIVFGAGSINSIAQEVKELGGNKVFIVTGPNIAKSNLFKTLVAILNDNYVAYECFNQIESDPRYELVEEILAAYFKSEASVIIGFGGGSALDLAKGLAILATNEGPINKYFGVNLIPKQGAPLVLVPTTAGSGSESTIVAIFSDDEAQLKIGISSPYLLPNVAILDPELTLSLSPAITASTGIDALIHAVEAYTSVNASPMTDVLAIEAIKIISANLRTAYNNGLNIEARTQMLRGSLLAGMAFSNAGVTAVHAFAYPIGAKYHIPHGVANSIMFLPVMQFNCSVNEDKFAQLARVMGLPQDNTKQMALDALQYFTSLISDLNLSQHLSDFGVKKDHIPELSNAVLLVTRLLANNAKKISYADAVEIYTRAL